MNWNRRVFKLSSERLHVLSRLYTKEVKAWQTSKFNNSNVVIFLKICIKPWQCPAALFICENLGTSQAKATYTVHAGQIFENENIDLHLKKACRTPTIQTVTEHRTASTDRRCKYLNGYVTVQHCSFGKPSFLDPRNLRLDPCVLKLEAFELRDVRIESRVSSV